LTKNEICGIIIGRENEYEKKDKTVILSCFEVKNE